MQHLGGLEQRMLDADLLEECFYAGAELPQLWAQVLRVEAQKIFGIAQATHYAQ